MVTYDIFMKNIKNRDVKNSYILCGPDEELIKDATEELIKPFKEAEFAELNFLKIDGLTASFDNIMNACETMPLMSQRKAVVVYRANFLRDKSDSTQSKLFNDIKEYLKNMPSYTVLIMYYVFGDKRETPKKNKKLMSLDKLTEIVHVDKLRRDGFIRKVQEIFKERSLEIGRNELAYFCDKVPSNFEIIKNEVDKLSAYTSGRQIRREDIDKLLPRKSEEDIFDLVDLISQGKIEKSMDIMDDMLFKADQHMLIITAIENQFKKLYKVKLLLNQGKRVDDLVSILRVPSFVCEKLVNLSKKFSMKQLEGILKVCIETEITLKSKATDKTTELELLLIKMLMIKK